MTCPWCSTLLASDMDPQRDAVTPEHEPATKRQSCRRCQALEDALEHAVAQALEWRDAARVAALIVLAMSAEKDGAL